jgi:hypothetical protein
MAGASGVFIVTSRVLNPVARNASAMLTQVAAGWFRRMAITGTA